jgi:hypothetical protein
MLAPHGTRPADNEIQMKLKLEKRVDGWWITGYPGGEDCGPYLTKAEADEDRHGLERTLEHGHEKDFWTSRKL